MEHDLVKLEKQLKTLEQRITELQRVELAEKLGPIIHRPGWTTLPEFFLVSSAIESLTHQLEGQIRAFNQLLEGAKMIEKASAKAA